VLGEVGASIGGTPPKGDSKVTGELSGKCEGEKEPTKCLVLAEYAEDQQPGGHEYG
jgi:hypothetical protein